jgi:hypothetical protein
MTDSVRTVPISGRIAQDDYDFLMARDFGGKVTASEKLRHMAAFFRHYHENLGDYGACLEELNRLLEPARRNLARLEHRQGLHSELVDHTLGLLPQALALLISRQEAVSDKRALPYLLETEERLMQILLRLVEHLLRLGLTRQAPTYNPNLLEGRLAGLVELVGLISASRYPSQPTNPTHLP